MMEEADSDIIAIIYREPIMPKDIIEKHKNEEQNARHPERPKCTF